MRLESSVDDGVTKEHSLTHQPLDKDVGILIVRKLPDRAIQPERVARSGRQVHPAIHQPACGQMWQKRAQLQQDADPLPLCRRVSHRSGFGLGTPQRHGDLALESAHYELTVVHGNREKRINALTMTAPDPFDKRRVRRSFFIDDNHASPPVAPCEEHARRRSSGSRIAVASSLLAPRNLTKRANPPANASANASSLPNASSSNHQPRMTNVFVVRSSLLSKRATSRAPHNNR